MVLGNLRDPSGRRSGAAALAVLLASLPVAGRGTGVAGSCPQSSGLTLAASAPRLQQVLTHLTLSTLAGFGTANGPSFYSVTVVNAGSAPAEFRLGVELKFIPSDPTQAAGCADRYPDGGTGCWIQRQSSFDITLAPGQVWSKSSNQLNRLWTGGIGGDGSPFRSLVDRLGDIPPGRTSLSIGLLCPTGGNDPMSDRNSDIDLVPGSAWWTAAGDYLPARRPSPLAPGGDFAAGFPAIATNVPMFVFSGNLDRSSPGGKAPYRLMVWDFPEGASLDQVQSTVPVRVAEVGSGSITWPASWPPLEPGRRYVWRVDAILHGVVDDWLPSATWAFSAPSAAAAAGDPSTGVPAAGVLVPVVSGTAEQSEIVRLLSLLAGPYRPGVEGELRTKLPDPATLEIAGRPATVEQLRSLVQDVLAGRATVRSAGAER